MKKGIALLLALILCLGCALAETDLSKYVSNPDEKITIAWWPVMIPTPLPKVTPLLPGWKKSSMWTWMSGSLSVKTTTSC